MAALYIAEYQKAALTVNGGNIPAPQEPPIAEQKVTISGTSAASSAFAAHTRLVRVHTDAICHIAFGENPTAAATTKRLAADQTEYFGVAAGHKVAVISGS